MPHPSVTELYWSKNFAKQYAKLAPPVQAAVCRALAHFDQPGKVEPLQQVPEQYELRVGRRWRIIWHYGPRHVIILRSVGSHDQALERL